MLGQLLAFRYGDPEYRCYIYEEKPGENFLYSMTRTSSYCGAYSQDYEYFYRIYNESVAPGMPVIEGYDPTKELYLGAPLRLVCRSSGGFPPAKLKWFRNGDEIPSESLETKAGSENHIDVMIREDDDGAEYRCDAINFADTLATAVVLFLRPDPEPTTTAEPEITTAVTPSTTAAETTTTATTTATITTDATTTDATTTTTTTTTTVAPSTTTTEFFYEYYVGKNVDVLLH
ncbi:endochitinase A-like [Penaeus chinensis]|uniref:endochitinase A-like n=1 Tax=Penaeus chinensis TaxID=139456 RepID=UPI001FB69C75|nr:endochitinase A-like [Penaeus chinensis]